MPALRPRWSAARCCDPEAASPGRTSLGIYSAHNDAAYYHQLTIRTNPTTTSQDSGGRYTPPRLRRTTTPPVLTCPRVSVRSTNAPIRSPSPWTATALPATSYGISTTSTVTALRFPLTV